MIETVHEWKKQQQANKKQTNNNNNKNKHRNFNSQKTSVTYLAWASYWRSVLSICEKLTMVWQDCNEKGEKLVSSVFLFKLKFLN